MLLGFQLWTYQIVCLWFRWLCSLAQVIKCCYGYGSREPGYLWPRAKLCCHPPGTGVTGMQEARITQLWHHWPRFPVKVWETVIGGRVRVPEANVWNSKNNHQQHYLELWRSWHWLRKGAGSGERLLEENWVGRCLRNTLCHHWTWMLDTMLQGLVSALSCSGPPSLFILLPGLSFGVEILVLWHSVLEENNCFLFILF